MKLIRTSEIPDEQRARYSIKRLFTESLAGYSPKDIGLYQTTIRPGGRCPCHCHNNLLEILFFHTSAVMMINNKRYDILPKDYIILKAGEQHEIIAEGKEAVVLTAIKIPNIVNDRFEP